MNVKFRITSSLFTLRNWAAITRNSQTLFIVQSADPAHNPQMQRSPTFFYFYFTLQRLKLLTVKEGETEFKVG